MRAGVPIARMVGMLGMLNAAVLATHPVQDVRLISVLNGQNEVGPSGQLGAGDLDASGTISMFEDHGVLVFDIAYQDVSGEAISGLHIHGPEATPATNRPIFIDLLGNMNQPPALTLPGGSFRGVVANFELADEVRQVFQSPHGFYVNLHTSGSGGFPSGAIRGMLPEPEMAGVLLLLAGLVRRRCQRG